MLSLIAWLIFGALIGWVASKIMNTDAQQGAVLNIGGDYRGIHWRFFDQPRRDW